MQSICTCKADDYSMNLSIAQSVLKQMSRMFILVLNWLMFNNANN